MRVWDSKWLLNRSRIKISMEKLIELIEKLGDVTRTGLVVDVPLLDAGQAVGVGAGQDDVRLSLQADAALVQRIGVDVACQLLRFIRMKHEVLSQATTKDSNKKCDYVTSSKTERFYRKISH